VETWRLSEGESGVSDMDVSGETVYDTIAYRKKSVSEMESS